MIGCGFIRTTKNSIQHRSFRFAGAKELSNKYNHSKYGMYNLKKKGLKILLHSGK